MRVFWKCGVAESAYEIKGRAIALRNLSAAGINEFPVFDDSADIERPVKDENTEVFQASSRID